MKTEREKPFYCCLGLASLSFKLCSHVINYTWIPSSNCSQDIFYFPSPCIYSSWVLYIHRANPYRVFKLGSQIMIYREIPSLICLRENFLLAFSMHPFFFKVQTSLWMNVLIYQTRGTKQQFKTLRHETTDST